MCCFAYRQCSALVLGHCWPTRGTTGLRQRTLGPEMDQEQCCRSKFWTPTYHDHSISKFERFRKYGLWLALLTLRECEKTNGLGLNPPSSAHVSLCRNLKRTILRRDAFKVWGMWFWNRKNLGQLSSLVIAGWWESWNSLLLCEWWRNLCAFFRTGSASLCVLSVSKAWFLSFYVRYFKQPILPMWWRHNRIDPPHLARQCIIAFVAKKLPIVEIWRRRYRCILLGSSSHEEFMHFFLEYTSE